MRKQTIRWDFTIALFIVGFGLYARSLTYEFIWDDGALVTGAKSIVDALGDKWAAHLFRPLFMATIRLNWSVSHSPVGFHLVNVLLHSVNGALLFVLLKKLDRSTALASACALLFICWSGAVEPVAFISCRPDLLVTLGVLILLLGAVPTATSGLARRLPLMLGGALIAALSKEVGIIPVGAILLFTALDQQQDKRQRMILAGALGGAIVFCVGWRLASVGLALPPYGRSLLERAGFIGRSVVQLTGFDARVLHDAKQSGTGMVALGSSGLFAGAATSLLLLRQRKLFCAMLLALVLALLVVNTEALRPSVRYLYLPTMLLVVLASSVANAASRRVRPTLVIVSISMMAVTWAGFGQLYLPKWRSELYLFAMEVSAAPRSLLARHYYAEQLVFHGQYKRALALLQRNLAQRRSSAELLLLAECYLRLDQPLAAYRALTSNVTRNAKRYLLLGEALAKLNKTSLARKAFERALALDPKNSGIRRRIEQLE